MSDEKQPLVSVVIPCYNHENFVQDCIRSVINQTYQNIELIIIDDGSKDNSVSKIEEMSEKCKRRFVRFEFRHRANKGLSATLNEALEWCEGEYYCSFASDDIMTENRIKKQLEYLNENPKCAGVFGAFEVINPTGLVENVRKKNNKKYYFKDIFLHEHELPAPTQLLRMEVVKKIGGYVKGIVIEDWFMWLKITELGYSLDYIDEIFVKYRRHDSNTSNQLELMHQGRLDVIKIFDRNNFADAALAHVYLVSANEYLSINLRKSWNLYWKFLCMKKKLISKGSFKYILKLILRLLKW